MPDYTGKYSGWENFRDVYTAMIHRRDDLPAVVEFYDLRTHLKDEALALIKNLPLKEENYSEAGKLWRKDSKITIE